ncbi:non-ribosomal peptide synthetase [Actinophytocola oryzae]|uniref:Amino acid adenylation domain-containing protein n=1 Tax=Actinophytocola oryzae TaxID=502181 RepID=A0A4R7V5G4_9PSEU|nr:non-ribosomal peptide synthetase [Actinophytocola oryzae]TDV43185.1 amino acid adenylation domain-containing protein [Actinophytocola oryzae]
MTDEPTDDDVYVLPASFGQERLWTLDLLGAGPAYNLNGAVRLRGPLDPARLHAALATVVARHEALRTTFEFALDGGLVQVIHPRIDLPVTDHDVRAWPADERVPAAVKLVEESVTTVFDLTEGPLLRVVVVRLGDADRVLGLTVHHTVADGWSIGIILDEVAGCLRADLAGVAPELPELPVQFGDWAAWQREQPVPQADLDYWAEQLRGAQPVMLPVRAEGSDWAAGGVPVVVPAGPWADLTALATRQRATPFMVLLAAFAVATARWCDQEDLVIGTPVAGRNRAELQGLIGFFLNTLPLRVIVRGELSFRELLARVRQTCLDAYSHQDLPFERIAEKAASGGPLARVMFGLQPSALPGWQVPGLSVEQFPVPERYSQVDLALTLFADADGGVTGRAVYATGQCTAADVTDVLDIWQRVLAWVAEHPDVPVGRFDPLSRAERAALLADLDATDAELPWAGGVVASVEAAVDATPEAVAVVADDGCLTYAELEERANSLAWFLRANGVGPDELVGVCLPRSASLVVALLAVLKAGGAYLPLESGYPRARLAFMIADARPRVLVADATTVEALPADPPGGCRVVRVDRPEHETVATRPEPLADRDNLAYVIYTSGSTGTPKGAMNTHAAVANQLGWMREAYGLAPGEGVLHKTPIGFDTAGWEWLWPLTAAARLVVARPDGHHDPGYLAALVREHGVTTCNFVPSMLHHFLADPAAATCAPTLRRVLCIGEELPSALAARFFAVLPGAELHNLYGPTEAAIAVTARHVVPGDEHEPRVSIGRPIAGTLLRVLDGDDRVVRTGLPGELCLGGVQLARGYARRPGLTADRFTPDPFGSGARLYRTGDRVRVLPSGDLEFLGRIDDQVKLRGHRVELGEIESALVAHPLVDQAAADVVGDGAERGLVAYLVCGEPAPGVDELRADLRTRLPAALIPESFVTVPALPLTPNGKLDRAALRASAGRTLRTARPYVAPSGPAEQMLVRIWSEVLGVDDIGTNDDFYELGGNSLRAVTAYRVAQQHGLLLPLPMMLGDHTIRDLSGALGDDAARALLGFGPPAHEA